MPLLSERRLSAFALLFVALTLLYQTFGQAYSGLGAFSPMFFPRIILGFWVAVSLFDVLVELRQSEASASARILRVGAIALASLAFLYAMPRLGFFLSAVPFSVFALLVLGLRAPLPILAVGVGVPGALVALFNHALTLPLPTSPFTWWF